MTLYKKLREILDVEKINMDIKPSMSWLTAERLLSHRKLKKYCLWVITGEVIPEAGQISPAIAHNGLMKIIFR